MVKDAVSAEGPELDRGAMRTRGIDVLWVVVALLFAIISALGAVSLFTSFEITTLIGLPFTVMVALGAWKRTKWGAPAGGLREHQEQRRHARSSAPPGAG